MLEKNENQALLQVISLAQQWSGCNFMRYNLSTLGRRVARRMIDARCRTVEEYLRYLESHPVEYPRLVTAMTIKVSRFFRDTEVFELIREVVLPQIFDQKAISGRRTVRLWSSACACGEEAYSLAILVAEALASRTEFFLPVTILATDLDLECLASAAEGIYHEEELREVPETLRNRYFMKIAALPPHYRQAVPELRSMLHFAAFDLTNESRLAPPSGIFLEYDFILCRNMLIYCQNALKRDILARLHACLRPGGYLALGRAESLSEEFAARFDPIDSRLKVFAKKEK
jgi:two-component system CheB/CheR fusion protein